jgi:hypothetical protein
VIEGTAGRRGDARLALTAGLAIVLAYLGLAAWSGALSPLARSPLLDGLGPLNYRWVSPPPELASTNQPPSSGRFDLPLGEDGVGTQVVFTSDSQVTIVVDDGSIGPARGEDSAQLLVDPIDPAGLAPPPGDLVAFGNAYSIAATYRPSRDEVRGLDRPIQAILLYPATSTLHATSHDMLFSADGEAWETLETVDSPGQQQAQADVPDLGYVMVAGVPAPPSPSPAAAGSGGTPSLAVALLVAAGVVLLIGVGLLIRGRSR